MYSQNAITNFETKAQTFRNDNYMSNDIELPWQHIWKRGLQCSYASQEECIGEYRTLK